MLKNQLKVVVLAAAVFAGSTHSANAGDTFRYKWSLRGPMSWVAGGLNFPNSGVGEFSQYADNGAIATTLRITSPKEPNAGYIYESQMTPSGDRTFTSHEGYDWRGKTRHLRSVFDFAKGLLRIQKRTSDGTEEKVKVWKETQTRDVLTGIQYLRANASSITKPMSSRIYSGGKAYPVLFVPVGQDELTTGGQKIMTREFKITAAPNVEDKYPGEVHVWISDDDRRIPVRIEIKQSVATLRLDLKS